MKASKKFLVVAGLIMTALSQPSHAEIYKWRDANGVLHYGNTLPAQDSGAAITTLDNHGMVIKQTAAAPTAKERAAQAAQAAAEAKQNAAKIEQQRQDTSLINTYTSPAEIDLARNHNLELTQLVITGIQSRLDLLLETRARLVKQTGGEAPMKGSLSTEYTTNEQHIQQLQMQLEQKQQELADINKKYDQEKARFIELTGKSNSETAP